MTPDVRNLDKSRNQDGTFFIDITPLICPMTFVRTKLMLEKLENGQILQVRLKGREPLANVPRSVTEHGHEIVSLEKESPDDGDDGVHLLTVRKTGA